MKYFDKKYVIAVKNSALSKEERDEYDSKWKQSCRAYEKECCTLKHRFPKTLRKILNDGALHDAFINGIRYERVKKSKKKTYFNIILDIEWRDKNATLNYVDVKKFNCDMDLNNYVPFGDYLYGEFLVNKEGLYIHNFLLFLDSEINITCKKIDFKWCD